MATNRRSLKNIREADKNSYEAGFDSPTNFLDPIKNEISADWKLAVNQMLGLEKYAAQTAQKMEGELREGEEISFTKKTEEKIESRREGDTEIDYARKIVHAESIHLQRENSELGQKLDQIRVELKKITETSKELETAFKQVATETITRTVKPGKYHVNFFEWMLETIQNARIRIESSANWIHAISGKRSKKDYWSLSKKHGTSYSMSADRMVSQQTG